jgi:Carboxypeptidase regulatory-like domain/TonB dependent receptor-like, beta-barrel/TonB-dependent Receptor Plug Domain
MRNGTLTVLLAALFGTSPVLAQEQRGSIEGVVKDSSGGLLPGVTVEAKSPALVGLATTVTDGRGVYRFPALRPGVYEVSAHLQGFRLVRVENVELQLGQFLKIDLTLTVASLIETVQVTAESPIIDVKQNAATATINAEVIERIPKGRDFTDLIKAAPGTQVEAKSGIQIDGAGGSEHRYIIDGMDTTGIRTGVSGQELPPDFVQEVQVKSSGYNAEFRATTGGVVSAITKTGSNQFRGGAGFYFRNNTFEGKQRPTVRLDPADQTKAQSFTTPEDDISRFEPTFDLGGPILRNRVWFYVGYAPEVAKTSRTVTFRSTNETATFDENEVDHNLLGNVSAQLTGNMRLRFSMNQQRYRDLPGPNPNGSSAGNFPAIEPDGTSTSNPSLFPGTINLDTFDNFYVGVFDWVIHPKLYANVGVGLYDYGTHGVGAGTQLRHVFGASNFQFPEIPAALQNVNAFADYPSSSVTVFDDFKRNTVTGDLTYYASKWGDHMIKGGLQYERITNERLGGAQYPTVTLNWGQVRAALDGRRIGGTYGHYAVTRVYNSGDIHTNGVGVFLQDAWTPGKNLTLNVGIRTDKEEIPSYTAGNQGIKFGFKDKISPRVGFAWDVFGNSQWKGYGSFGIFYDTSKLEMPRGLFGSEHSVTYYYTLDTFNWPSIQCGHPPTPGPACPGTFIEQVDFRHAANEADNFLIDPNLKPIRTREFTLGMDHELNQTISVGVRYARKRFDRTIEDTGVLVPGIGEVYRITNPGESIGENVLRDFAACTTCPNQPKPTRNYDGVEFRLRKRLSNNWSVTTSYLYSRLYGNYSGLTSSDENNRNAPSVNRFFDGQYYSFNRSGQPVFGFLQTDRPHLFEVQATYDLPWGTGIGLYLLAETGTPLQTQMSEKGIPFYPFGRNDLGRTPMQSQTDLLLQHSFRFGTRRLNVGLNITNLFDQDVVTRRFTTQYRDSFNVTDQAFFSGAFDPVSIATATPASYRPDPRFGLPDQWQSRRTVRLNAHWVF